MLPAIVPDPVLHVLKLVGKHFVGELIAERQKAAEEILLKKIRGGRVWNIKESKAGAAMFTYFNAAQEGVARQNLELLAEALVVSAQEATFAPDEFRRHAVRLADLTREEIIIAAEFIRVRRLPLPPCAPAPVSSDGFKSAEISRNDPGAEAAQGDNRIWQTVQESLLLKTSIFPNQLTLHGYAGALTRTGWISYIGGWDDGMFRATPLLDAIERLVEWPGAARRAEMGEDA